MNGAGPEGSSCLLAILGSLGVCSLLSGAGDLQLGIPDMQLGVPGLQLGVPEFQLGVPDLQPAHPRFGLCG